MRSSNNILKLGNLLSLNWLYERFTDLFGESKKPYLMDCAIMFTGILQHTLKYNHFAYENDISIHKIVRYCVKRMIKIIDEVADADEQLIKPELFESWLPNCKNTDKSLQKKLNPLVLALKKALNQQDVPEKSKLIELLDFIQDELFNSKNPRQFLIESALLSLKSSETVFKNNELLKLDQVITDYFRE